MIASKQAENSWSNSIAVEQPVRVHKVHPRKTTSTLASVSERSSQPVRKLLPYKIVPKTKQQKYLGSLPKSSSFTHKTPLLKNKFRTATTVWESFSSAQKIATSNGYYTVGASQARFKGNSMLPNNKSGEYKVPFLLPFISNEVSIAIECCLKRAGMEDSVALVEIRPETLKRQSVRNRLYDRLCETNDCKVCPNGRDGG
ncbi:hypothetical protein KIN20_001386 [Parelaphostrongylus tenuis]|uniref:Uncharacterized protein n=1 Tax=Parelaphostrongylus tenuis TaxID=148309 RepID=A0AAD5LWY3_PARTN|nr:hypothetical protein KIN20_001386 [Parelaphostrongylus tenuis]